MARAELGVPTPIPAAWRRIDIGSGAIGVAERDALGTGARVAVWPPRNLPRLLTIVDSELARLDRQVSRFRADSEISRIHSAGGVIHRVSEGLAEAIRVALAAARWTGGLVDPTVGAALVSLGYDRDFVEIGTGQASVAPVAATPVPGWQTVRLDGAVLRLPDGITLDLGATAKGLGADRAAAAAFAAAGTGGVLVSLGGDIAVVGEAPMDGWPVWVADADTTSGMSPTAAQLVRLAVGALASSSTTCRRWQRNGQQMHHIVDPRTGLPANGPWRTASVAAATCAAANAASTAAIVAGEQAEAWLVAEGLTARLVAHDGTVRLTGGWPATNGGTLPASCRGLFETGSYQHQVWSRS